MALALSMLIGEKLNRNRLSLKESPMKDSPTAQRKKGASNESQEMAPQESEFPSKWAEQITHRSDPSPRDSKPSSLPGSPSIGYSETNFPPEWKDELMRQDAESAAYPKDVPPPDPDEVPIGELPDALDVSGARGGNRAAAATPPKNIPWWGTDSKLSQVTSTCSTSCNTNWRHRRELAWQADDASPTCLQCGAAFNFVRRRHHCRGCGRLLCADCTQYRAIIPQAENKQRVCSRCISTRFSLYGAAQAGDAASVKRLVEVQGGPSRCDTSALEDAVNQGNLTAVQVLVHAGVELDKGNEEGVTTLMQAAFHGHADVVKVLVEAGANVDKKDGFGRDALDHAAKGGNVSTFCQVLRDASIPGDKDGERQTNESDVGGSGFGVKLRDMVQWG